MRKCSWVRSDKENSSKRCPFGLPITEACINAGSSITQMCPLEAVSEEKQKRVLIANRRVYIYYKENERCLYAANIIKKYNSVNCNFGDSAQGIHMNALEGSPLYAQTFSGIGLDGLYAFPMGMYADNNESRNLFQGLFSLVGSEKLEIVKTAMLEDENMKHVVDRLEMGEELTSEEMEDLKDVLLKCRTQYEKNVTNPAKIVELVNKYNPRKRL